MNEFIGLQFCVFTFSWLQFNLFWTCCKRFENLWVIELRSLQNWYFSVQAALGYFNRYYFTKLSSSYFVTSWCISHTCKNVNLGTYACVYHAIYLLCLAYWIEIDWYIGKADISGQYLGFSNISVSAKTTDFISFSRCAQNAVILLTHPDNLRKKAQRKLWQEKQLDNLLFFWCPGIFAIAVVSFSSLKFLIFAK